MEGICIDDKERKGDWPSNGFLKEGETYIILWLTEGTNRLGNKVLLYWLKGDTQYAYERNRFIILGNKDETTFSRDFSKIKETEKV